MNIMFQHVGWKSKLSKKRATFSISLKKEIVVGCCLTKGQGLYSYLAVDNQQRPIMITYLDGKSKIHEGKYTPAKTDVTDI